MIKPSILVVGETGNTQTHHQVDMFRSMGANVLWLPPWMQGSSFAWSSSSLHFRDKKQNDLRLDTVQGVLIRSLPPEVATAIPFIQSPSARLSFEEWFQHNCLQRDRFYTIFGLVLAYERAGVPMFNPPGQSHIARRKPFQLEVMRRLGCPMPETLITNDPSLAKSFINEVGEAIVKPCGGGALTLATSDLSPEELELVRIAPAIFQQRIYGTDIRVMVLDDEVVSSVGVLVAAGTLDFRGDTDYQACKAKYCEIELPPMIRDMCIQFASDLGLRFVGIDLKHTPSGEFMFIECNSGPIYLDVERKMGHPITEKLCRRIIAEASNTSPGVPFRAGQCGQCGQ